MPLKMTVQAIHINGSIATKPVKILKGWPLIGNAFDAWKDPLVFLKKTEQQQEEVVRIRVGHRSFYMIQSPAAFRHVLQENARNYFKPGAAKMMKRFLGDGLATSNGEKWLQQRRLIQPAFHKTKINGLIQTIEEETGQLISDLNNTEPGIHSIDQVFLKLTLSNITKTMFGTDLSGQLNDITSIINDLLKSATGSVTSLVKFPAWVPSPANRRFSRSNHRFEKIIYSIIEERKQGTNHGDLLDLLLHAHEGFEDDPMSLQQLRDEITTIFMAGHETTAQTLSWVFYQVALNPELSEKLRSESSNRYDQMPYTKAVIEETMRIYPPVWIMARKSINDDVIENFHVPASSTILLNVYGLNHSSKLWNDPGTFSPRRMLPGEKEKLVPFLFIPFGGGQRLCIGNQFAMLVMQVVVSKLIQQFEFKVPPGFNPITEPNVTLRAKHGIQLMIKKIEC